MMETINRHIINCMILQWVGQTQLIIVQVGTHVNRNRDDGQLLLGATP